MRNYHHERKAKNNLAKFAYDLAKITIGVTVITPLDKPDVFSFLSSSLGLRSGVSITYFGYYLDTAEVRNDDL